jgi:hypothetical protein
MKSALAAVLALLLMVVARAVEVDSVGTVDWHRAQVGAPLHVVAVDSKHQVWATDAQVLAGVATRSGDLDWRLVLPKGAWLGNCVRAA